MKSPMHLKLYHKKVRYLFFESIKSQIYFIETSKEIVPNHRPSFLRRILSDLILAGLIGFAFKMIKRWFRSVRKNFLL
jgi:hypothetical protein